MKKRPLFVYTEGPFYKIWISICALITAAAIVNSFLVYIQVSRQLKANMEQRLLWEANFYRQQLNAVFIRTAQRLDSLVHSTAAVSANRALLQKEMETIHTLSPSVIRSWIAYPDGMLIPAPNTRPDYVRTLSWWRGYLAGDPPKVFSGLWVGRGQSLIGDALIDPSNLTTLIPLFSLKLQGINVIRAAGAQLDLNIALTDNSDIDISWNNAPVSIYTADGRLLACPYRYDRGIMKPATASTGRHPLILEMQTRSGKNSGFKIYEYENRKMAGIYLRDPQLGLVLTVEYPASDIVDPVSRIAFGPLMVTALLIVIATILVSTLYSNTKRLHRVEQLARQAELRALQAHINPHFLFNTLDRMGAMAVATANTPLLNMIRSLANMFRYIIRQKKNLVTLNEELNYLQEYIALQQIRYGSRFGYQLEAAPDLLAFQVFKFSIQPLVENCFVHGVEKTFDPVTIRVIIRKDAVSLNFCVSDDGPGITPQRLAEINRSLATASYEPEEGHGVGLSNIHHLYQYAYGEGYGIRLEPLEQGLAVYLKTPLA